MTQSSPEIFVVEVSCIADFEDLDPNDTDAAGSCIVDGSYRIALAEAPAGSDRSERVLDIFHMTVPIKVLEDYEIIARPATVYDMQSDFRGDLGTFPWSETPPEDPLPDPR